jgi:hypothetical protein
MFPVPTLYGTLVLSDSSFLIGYKVLDSEVYDIDEMLKYLHIAWCEAYQSHVPELALGSDYKPELHGWLYTSRVAVQMYVSFLLSCSGAIVPDHPNHLLFQIVTPMKSPGSERQLLDWEREFFYRGLFGFVRSLDGKIFDDSIYFQYSPSFVQERFYQAVGGGMESYWRPIES